MSSALAFAVVVLVAVGVTGGILAWSDSDPWLVCTATATVGIVLSVPLARRAVRPARTFLDRQDQFVASAVHEVRGPLARLEAVAAGGLLGDDDPIRALHGAEMAARAVLHTIDDLIVVGELGARGAELPLAPLRLDLLVAEVLGEGMMSPSVETDLVPTVVLGHPVFRRAVRNLVDNAMRHGGRGQVAPEVLVTVRPSEVIVADSGSGLPDEHLVRLQRAVSSGWRVADLGMGLTIVGQVAQAHGGEVHLANRPEGGLEVTVRLRPAEESGDMWR